MELDPSVKRSIWWKGAFIGAAKGLVSGIAIGFVAAGIMFGLATAFPSALAMLGTFVGVGTGFNPIVMMAFNGLIAAVTGMFQGGVLAVNAYKQDVEHKLNEARINELDDRTQMLEQTVAMAPSRNIQKILNNCPRHTASFEAAELVRQAQTPTTPTLY